MAMASDSPVWKYKTAVYSFPIVTGITAVFLNYRISRSPSHISNAEFSFPVVLSIFVLLISIWLLAVFGAVRFKEYASSIKDSQDGESLNYIANSLLWLIVYIVLLPLTIIVQMMAVGTPYLTASVAIGNHAPILLALVSVYLLHKGARLLVDLVPRRIETTAKMKLAYLICLIFFALFTWRFYGTVPGLEPVNGVPRFVVPLKALIFTYVLPHLILWTAGLLACRNLAHFAAQTQGKIYRVLFKNLYRGILLVYICIFWAQIFIISSITYANFNLGVLLIYALLMLAAAGFILIARGSGSLNKLEHTFSNKKMRNTSSGTFGV